MTDQQPSDVPTGATQLADVLAEAEAEGCATEFEVAADADAADALRCPACGEVSAASRFAREWSKRLEGASDPADMLHVSTLTCPNCGVGGVFVSPFGPSATQRQAAVLAALPAPTRERPPSADHR
jgi:predicted RNA-binding Zn-ribbon protein involved in translation (DUF1610 family)